MSENTGQRLGKVAKELNVSVSTITEFLKTKGFPMENNPMAKLSDDLYLLLSKEYQSEKAAKEEAKQVTASSNTSIRTKKDNISLDEESKKPETKKIEEEEDIIIKNVQNIPASEKVKGKSVETSSKKIELENEREEIKSNIKFTTIGKIDLDAINSKTKPAKKSKAEKKNDSVAKIKTPKTKEKVKEKTKATKGESKVKEKPTKSSVDEVAPIVEEKNNERAKENLYQTPIKKLEGPKIIGTIDLPIKEPKKPVASSSATTPRFTKKKRKRIKKSFGGGATLGDTWAPRTPSTPGARNTTAAGSNSAVGKPKFDTNSPRTKYA